MKKQIILSIICLLSFIYSYAQPECNNTFQTDKRLVYINGQYYKAIYSDEQSKDDPKLTDIKVNWQKISIDPMLDKVMALNFYSDNSNSVQQPDRYTFFIYNPIVERHISKVYGEYTSKQLMPNYYLWCISDSTELYKVYLKGSNLVVDKSIVQKFGNTWSFLLILTFNVIWVVLIGGGMFSGILSQFITDIVTLSYRRRTHKNPPYFITNILDEWDKCISSLIVTGALFIVYCFLPHLLPIYTALCIVGITTGSMIIYKLVALFRKRGRLSLT